MKKRVMLPLMLCLALALAFGVTACGGTGDSGNGGGGATEAKPAHVVYYVAGNEAATGTAPKPAAVTEGATFTAAENTFTLEGYTFVGWSDGSKTYAAGDTGTMGTADVVLTAQWTDVTYAVTYAAGDGTGTAPVQAAVAEGGTFTLADNTFTAPDGYVFGGWTDGTAEYAAGDTYTMGGAAVTITAVWDKVYTLGEGETLTLSNTQYTVTVNDDGSISISRQKYTTYPEFIIVDLGTYTYSIVGDTAEFTEVLDDGAEGEPETYIGSNYGGIVRITLPDSTMVEGIGDFTFFFPGIDDADFLANYYGNAMAPDYSISLVAYNNGYMTINRSGETNWCEIVNYDESSALLTYRLVGSRDEMTVKFKFTTYVVFLYENDGLAGTYTQGDRTVVTDGYRNCTINGIAGTYEPFNGEKYYVSDVDGEDAFIATFDPQTGAMSVEEITVLTRSSVTVDGETPETDPDPLFPALLLAGDDLFVLEEQEQDGVVTRVFNVFYMYGVGNYLYAGNYMSDDNYYNVVCQVTKSFSADDITVKAYMTNTLGQALTVREEVYSPIGE